MGHRFRRAAAFHGNLPGLRSGTLTALGDSRDMPIRLTQEDTYGWCAAMSGVPLRRSVQL